MLSAQKSRSKHCVVLCGGRGQRFGEGHLSFSVPLWGGQEQWGLTHQWVTQEGAHGADRKECWTEERRNHTMDLSAAQQTSLSSFFSFFSSSAFSTLLLTSSRCPFFPLHLKFQDVLLVQGSLFDKWQLICISPLHSLLPPLPSQTP